MRKSITTLWTVISIVALSTSSDVHAANASKQENIGVGTGAVIGAVAGGPIGFVVGAAIGAKIGDNMHKKNVQIETLEASLQNSRDEMTELQTDVEFLSAEVNRLEDLSQPELLALLQSGIDMDLLFRTDESALTNATGSRLTQLASSLATMSDLGIQLDGFADERGNESYNQTLSEKRVQYVRDIFVEAGVDASRISVNAHGESIAPDSNLDSLALERRVSVKLYLSNQSAVAKNH